MTTNSTYGWPIITKSDMFKPTAISALQGAAFDNRMAAERSRYEINVAAPGNLPNGVYVGQMAWVRSVNRPYFWTSANTWRTTTNVAGGTRFLNVSWVGKAMPIIWTGAITITLPAGRFTATPYIVVNAFAANRVVWGTVVTTPSSGSSFQVRIIAVAPGASQVRVNWVAVDSN